MASSIPAAAEHAWLLATIDARERALDAAAEHTRPQAAIRLARARTWRGDDVGAHELLVEERRRQRDRPPMVALCELGLAEVSLAMDDEDRATVHLQAGAGVGREDAPARALLAALVALRRGSMKLPEAPTLEGAPWFGELADLLAFEAFFARINVEQEHRGGDLRTRALREICNAVRVSDCSAIETGLSSLERAGLVRDAGRTILRVLSLAPELLVDGDDGATTWVTRARTLLGESATHRDRIAIRQAYGLHGRRDADRAIPREVMVRLDARDRMRAHVESTLAIGLDRHVRAADALEGRGADVGFIRDAIDLLDASTSAALSELERVESDLAQIVASTFAERERARAIARALAGLEGAADEAALLTGLAGVIAEQLGAAAVAVIEQSAGQQRAIFEAGFGADGEAPWVPEVAEALARESSSEPPRTRERRGGSDAPSAHGETPFLVVVMRTTGFVGALYVEKRARGSAFSPADQAALELFATFAGLAIGRTRATQASAAIGRRLAATIDAMRDGLLALDGRGVVTAANLTAARALRVEHPRLVGRRLAEFAELAPLTSALAGQDLPDGVVVRLPGGSVVVHARAVSREGIVVTLVEYERAQKMAQKLVGGSTRYTFADLRGEDPALLAALDMARRAAAVDASVLLVGETGTGKELVAQAIHAAGARAREPFVAINCAALPRDLLEAELFGYERGAFTGARAEGMVGKFELAGDGTLLLDEIVDLPLDMQAKLLRVLQERVVTRLGSGVERPVRARVLATAHRDLGIDVDRGRFRLDLLHRLRVLQIVLPPLRDRPRDIVLIARHYVRQIGARQGKAVRGLAPEVERALSHYAWPGNVRELANIIEAEVSLLSPDATTLEHVPSMFARALYSEPPPSASPPSAALRVATGIVPLAEVERLAYLDAYEKSQRSVTRAARALGVSKVTFYAKLRQFGMHPAEATGEIPSARSSGRMPNAEVAEPDPTPAHPSRRPDR